MYSDFFGNWPDWSDLLAGAATLALAAVYGARAVSDFGECLGQDGRTFLFAFN